MKRLLLLLALLPLLASAQLDSLRIEFTEDDDEFVDCKNHYSANGYYQVQPRTLPKLKIPNTILVNPLSLVQDSALVFSGKSMWARNFGWYETRTPYLEWVDPVEVDTLLKRKGYRYYSNVNVTELLKEEGIFEDKKSQRIVDSINHAWDVQFAHEEWIRDSIYFEEHHRRRWSGILNAPYNPRPNYFREGDLFEAYPAIRDSINLAHETIRRERIQPQIDSVLQPFYFSKFEVTNKDYREFVRWVRDSIARDMIYLNIDDDKEASEYINYTELYLIREEFIDEEGYIEEAEYEDYYDSDRHVNRKRFHLNWEKELHYLEENVFMVTQDMYYPRHERFYSRLEFDARKFNYQMNDEFINVMPDSVEFIEVNTEDSFYAQLYFWHPYYNNYPIVNISYEQVVAYCHWKEKQLNSTLKTNGNYIHVSLPSIAHYEFALKTTLEPELAERTKNSSNSHFTTYDRKKAGHQMSFLRRVDGSIAKPNKKRFRDGPKDETEKLIQQSVYNKWNNANEAPPFHFLNGNVSEMVSDQVETSGLDYYELSSDGLPKDNCYALGGNYAMGVKTRSDDPFNALFFKSILSKKESSPHIGFRLIYTVELQK